VFLPGVWGAIFEPETIQRLKKGRGGDGRIDQLAKESLWSVIKR